MKITLIFSAIIVTFIFLVSIAKLEKRNFNGFGATKSYREFTFIKPDAKI